MAAFEIQVGDQTFEVASESSMAELEQYFQTPEGQEDLAARVASGNGTATPVADEQAPPPPAQETDDRPQGIQNLAGGLQGMGLSEDTANAFAESRVSKFLLGVGKEVTAITRGLDQIVSTDEEAAELAVIELRERKLWDEMDEQGIGFEDLGQALPTLATMIAPGGNVVAGVSGAAKGLTFLKTLAGTLGGQAAMVGAIEGAKATTMEESRVINGLSGAGATVVGGKAIGALGRSAAAGTIGKMLTVAGLGKIMGGEGGRRASGGIMGYISRNLLGRQPKNAGQELAQRTAAAAGGPEARRIIETGTKERIKLAGQSNDLAAGRSQAWDAFLDIVKGPVSAKTGKRMVGGSLLGGAKPKAAVADGLDVMAERNRVVGTLLEAAKKPNPENPHLIDFDADALGKAWNQLKTNDAFRKVYGVTSKAGNWKLNKKGQAVEDLLDNLLRTGAPTGQAPTTVIAGLQKEGLEDLHGLAQRTIQEVGEATQDKVNKGFKLTPAQINQRAAGASLATLIDQNGGWGETMKALSEGDTWAWIDYSHSLQEKIEETRGNK